jgi:glutathione S-transferase
MEKLIRIWSFADVDRSGKVRWTAAELGYDVEESRLSLGEHLGEPYRGLNPFGQVPAAELDGKVLIESTAICIILAERHPEAGLIPAGGEARERFWQSISVSSSTLEMPLVTYFLSQSGLIDPAWQELQGASVSARLNTFAEQLPARDYLCGAFSLADICAAYCLRIGVQAGLLAYSGGLKDYLERMKSRPPAVEARFFDSLKV